MNDDNNKAEITADNTDFNKPDGPASVIEAEDNNTENKIKGIEESREKSGNGDMVDLDGLNRDFQGILDILGIQSTPSEAGNELKTEEKAEEGIRENTEENFQENIPVDPLRNPQVNTQVYIEENTVTQTAEENPSEGFIQSTLPGKDTNPDEAVEKSAEEDPVERSEEYSTNSSGAKLMLLISAAIFVGLFLVGAFGKRPTYSESEKRALTERPELSFMGMMNGNYFSGIEKWFSDTFPFKERLLGMESRLEAIYGVGGEAYYGNKKDFVEDTIPETAESLAPVVDLAQKEESEVIPEETVDKYDTLVETNEDGTLKVDTEPKENVEIAGEQAGNIYVNNNKAYEIFYYNQGGSVKYASVINTIKAMLPECDVYDILVPNSFGVELDPSLQEELGSGNMPDAFNYIFSLMDPSVHRISMFETLSIHKDEYIYFNTDHHWTGLGAYYAYKDFCREKGISPHELSEYQYVDYAGFYGTFYFATNRNEALKSNPDHVEAWIPMGTNDAIIVDENGTQYKSKVINDVNEANAGRKYNCFLNGDNAFTIINNPAVSDGSSCVVIKESYGNAFAPFLVDHYQNVYVVDYRYYKDNLSQFIRDNKVQDIIFVNNVQAITEKVSDEILSVFS